MMPLQPVPVPRRRRALYLILLLLGAGCDRNGPQADQAIAECIDNGEFTASLFGAIETRLQWRNGQLQCDGMPRPHGQGARLHFAGPATSDGETLQLAFIIAVPNLKEGQRGIELPVGVTLIEETTGRFFSTPDPSGCWADVEQQDPAGDASEAHYRIEGLLYCVSPLAEVNGSASVSFTDMRFAGRLSWQEPR
jgi:hypothetical protein